MNEKRGKEAPGDMERLRQKALERLRETHPHLWSMDKQDVISLVHELEVHQAELAVQNEELLRVQAFLDQARERYQDLYEFAPVGYLTLDAEGRVKEANRAAADLLLRQREAVAGRRFEELVEPEDRDDAYRLLRMAAAKERSTRRELRLLSGQREPVWVAAEAAALKSPDEDVAGMRLTLTDITERKQIEERLRSARDELDERVRQRTADLAETVNALRQEVRRRETAEASLRERSDRLRSLAAELASAEQRERMQIAQVLHDGLQQLLAGARYRLARIERHPEAQVRDTAAAVGGLLADAIESSRSLTADLNPPILRQAGLVPALEWLGQRMHEEHGQNVVLKCRGGEVSLPDDVAIFLFRAVRELLFNVVKHAGTDAALVDVVLEPGRDLTITVADDGVGFDATSGEGPLAGTPGFGLFSIAERIELMGGRFAASSEPGQGSRFELSLPLAPAKSPGGTGHGTEPSATAVAQTGHPRPAEGGAEGADLVRVALADDHVVVRQGMAILLRSEKDMVIAGEASNGEAAIDLVRKEHPDVVLMDISMPVMNGIDATRVISREFPDVSVVGLSMFTEAERAAAMLEAGAVEYVSKNDPAEVLADAVRRAAAKAKQRPR